MADFSHLFSLKTNAARQQWLMQHVPARSDALLAQLWAEATVREQRDPHAVETIIQAAREMATLWQDQEVDAIALRIEASMARALGHHDTALLRYNAAIALYHQLGMSNEAARTTVGPVDALMYLGQYDRALQLADWAISEMRLLGDDAVLSRLLVNRGNIYARVANYPAAQQAYAEARYLLTVLDQPDRVAMVEANEANILTNLNEFREAEERYRHARQRFVATGLTSAVAQIDHNLGYLSYAQGEYQQALRYFATARTIFETQQSTVDIAYVDLYRAEIYLALNLWPEALDAIRAAQPLFAEALMEWEAGQALLIEAAARRHLEQYHTADALLARAQQIFVAENNPFWIAITAVNQGVAAWHQGNLGVARQLVTTSLQSFIDIGVPSRAAQCAITLGEMLIEAGHNEEALPYFQQALALIGDTPLPAITYRGHYGLARVYQQRSEHTTALSQYEQAIAEIEQAQATIGAEDYKMAYRRDKLPIYEALILLYLEEDTVDSVRAAFDLVERAKARGLLDTIARLDEEEMIGIPDELLPQYEALRREISWYYHRLHTPTQGNNDDEQQRTWHGIIQQAEAKLADLWEKWRQPDLMRAPQNPAWIVSSMAIQQALPPNTLLLEYFTTEDHLVVFVLSQDQMWSRKLPLTRSVLAHLLDQLRFQFNKFSYGTFYRNRHRASLLTSTNDLLHTLYAKLLMPLPEIRSAEHLIIVPHGALHAVPFHALWQNDHYLLETHAVSYAPSATILHRVLTNPSPVPTDPPLLIGVSDPAIPHVDVEIAGLRQLFPTAEIYVDAQATATRLLTEKRRASLLHISTHAIFRHDNPTFSSLKMADGWLTVNEISNLATVAPLVTLSACETGRTEIAPGDEFVGLCRSFFGIGTQSLVASLWRVEDRSTADLMVRFYRGLQAGMSAHEALRCAQLALLKTDHHPYYWAPFILTGNPLLQLFEQTVSVKYGS